MKRNCYKNIFFLLKMYNYDYTCLSLENVLAIVIIILNEYDDLTHFKKMCMIIDLYIKWDSLAKPYPI